MPNNSLYISILREPSSLFRSTFNYFYGIVPEFHHVPQKDRNSVEKWLYKTKEYWNPNKLSRYSFFAKNHMMFDFGYSALLENDDEISKAIKEIDERFDLILISDHMDESLVLLADILCCSLEDVVTLKLNLRVEPKDHSEKLDKLKKQVRK